MVSVLTEALVRRGNEVALFCAPGSASSARVVTLLDEDHPDEIERSLYEVDHVARAFAEIDRAPGERRFDVVHDHCGFTALGMADRLATPLVHTLHGQFTRATAAFYAQHQLKATLVAISRAQRAMAHHPARPPARRRGCRMRAEGRHRPRRVAIEREVTQVTTDPIAVLVRRLARPHASGGMVIERSVILAEGTNSAAILSWISDHDGIADSTVASTRSHGLHGPGFAAAQQAAPVRRFVLPARAFLGAPGD